jgi:hypothetical protein
MPVRLTTSCGMKTPKTFPAHAGSRVTLGLGTIRLVRGCEIRGVGTLPAGTVGDLFAADEQKDTAKCWFGSAGTTLSLDDIEPVPPRPKPSWS